MVKILEPSAELVWITENPEQTIAKIARTCYKSENKDNPENNILLLKSIIENGHIAMTDHVSASIKFITDRGISHEIVRHRIGCAYAQESTRYCNYSKGKFNSEISVIKPQNIKENTKEYDLWYNACILAEEKYLELIKNGIKAENARSVLPTCLKTEIVCTFSFTAWIHFFKLRLNKGAHPDIQLLANKAFFILNKKSPNIFNEKYFQKNENFT